MHRWSDLFEKHYREQLGEPSARLVVVTEKQSKNAQILCFPRQDGSTLLCTLGLVDIRIKGERHEIVARVKNPVPEDLPFVLINGLFGIDWPGPELSHGASAEHISYISPNFAGATGKTAMYLRNVPRGGPVHPIKNGPHLATPLAAHFITTAEHQVLEEEGIDALHAIFAKTHVDLSDIHRPSAVELRHERLLTLVVPEEQHELAKAYGAQFDPARKLWYLPEALDPWGFDVWLARASRSFLSRAKIQPLPVLPLDDFLAAEAAEREQEAATNSRAATSAQPPRVYEYHLENDDGSTVVVTSPIRVLSERFEYGGRKYLPRPTPSYEDHYKEDVIHCQEIQKWNSSRVLREQAAHVLAFLRARAPTGPQLKTCDELTIREGMLGILRNHFEVEEEQWGRHATGKMLRVDAILVPKERGAWRNRQIALGLEFKSPIATRSKGHKDRAVMAQCLDYSLCTFDMHPHILVFICPLPAYLRGDTSLFVFLARYGVGYVEVDWRTGLQFKLGNSVLWNERDGVGYIGRKSSLVRRLGNRDAAVAPDEDQDGGRDVLDPFALDEVDPF